MYLGIDLGTSSVKVVVLDSNTIVDQASVSLELSRPQALWSEQDPADWWAATVSAIQALNPNYRSQIKTIGLAGQMHGAVILGKNDRVLRPAILWNDARSQQECLELTAKVPDLEIQFGNKLMSGFTSPKLAWIKKHEPELFDQIEKVLLPKDYIRLKLSGNYATDMSDASGTGWLNVGARTWSETLLAANDLTLSAMPTLHEGTELTGNILAEVASDLGLSQTVSIAAGGGDNAAAAVSMNVIQNGSAFLSLGTSGVYFVSSDRYQPNPKQGVHMFAHCLPQTWHSMNCHLSATNCLTWLAEVTQSEILNLLEQAEHRSTEPLLFLPYLSGERSPHNNPFARGVFFGLTHDTQRADMLNAILEGIAFNFKEGQDAFDAAGIQVDKIYVVGGGSKSTYWGKILAAILNKPLIYCENSEVGAALGAARLAYLADTGADPKTVFPNNPIREIIEPNPSLVTHYQKIYPYYKKLYQNNLELFNQLYNPEV